MYSIYCGEEGGPEKERTESEHSKRYLLRSVEEMVLHLALCDCCSWKDNFWGEGRIAEE